MLQCGQPGITVGECRVNLALWSLAKSPLLIGADVRGFSQDIIALLTNHEVLAVNQDAAGVQGRLVATANGNQTQIWAGPLAPKGGLAFAVALVNLNNESSLEVELEWDALPGPVPPSASLVARDLWERQDLGPHTGSVKLTVEPHDCRFIRLSKPPSTRPGKSDDTAMTTSMDIPTLNWVVRSDWLDVKTGCGAAGDGNTDDTDALAKCIALISNGTNTPEPGKPSTLYFPPGRFVISRTLELYRTQGKSLIGSGATTELVWAGAHGGIMLRSNGAARQRFIGLTWNGMHRAAVGIDHDAAAPGYFETRIRHQNQMFIGFVNASIRVGFNSTRPGKLEASEVLYENCVFANNFAGIQLLLWNDYDNTIDGCHFANNSFGVQMHPYHDANAYVRNCRFERSSVADLLFAFHSSSVRRSVSVGSAAFVLSAGSTALGSYVVQDCRVDKWTSPKGAIQISHRGPLTAFDNRFTRGPSGSPAISLTPWSSTESVCLLSSNLVDGILTNASDERLLLRSSNTAVHEYPPGKQSASPISTDTQFVKRAWPAPSRIIDCVAQFGADPTGKNDSASSIQRCVNDAASGSNAMAYLPQGTFRICSPISVEGQKPF